MKRFLIKFGIVYGISIGIILTLEFLLFSRPNLYSYKQDYMNQHINDIKILIIGQSHFEEGIKPEYLRKDSIFNFAISGQGLIWTEQLAQRYIPQMKNLEVVFVPFRYGMGYHAKEEKPSEWLSTYRCMYYKYMHLHYNVFTDWIYWSEFLNSQVNYMDRLRTGKDNFLCGLNFSELDSLKGYIPLSLEKRVEEWETEHLPSEIDCNQKDETFFQRMGTIASLCQARGIRLVMIAIPWWKSAHAKMTQHGIAEMENVAEELMSKYPCIEYHNYVFDNRFTAEDFNDATHLNELGAPKFSKILKRDLCLY